MVRYEDGDILTSDANVIFHQVNCQMAMGSGLARQVRRWCPKHYEDFIGYSKTMKPEELLGDWICTKYNNHTKVVGLFGQLNYGTTKRHTDYNALEKGLVEIKEIVNLLPNNYPNCRFAVPYNLGCGLAGGDWNVVRAMLIRLFGDTSDDACDITLEIWKY